MKTTVELSDQEAEAARRLTGARTLSEAVARAVRSFVRDREQRRAAAEQLYGAIPELMTQEELRRMREDS